MSRYDIALGRKKPIKIVKKNVLELILRNSGNPNDFTVMDKAAVCLVIADKLFPASEDTAIDVAPDLMYMPDFIVARIARRLLGLPRTASF